MEVMVVNGKRYLINTDLDDHVLDDVCEGILKWYPSQRQGDASAYPLDANVEFEAPKMADLIPDKPYL